jgi:hypothetical protein
LLFLKFTGKNLNHRGFFNSLAKNALMNELLDYFIQHGLTSEQAKNETISEWLKEEYPVAGTLMDSWIKTR